MLPPLESLPTPQSQLSYIDFTPDEIFSLLSHLDSHKSPGCDGISGHVLKNCSFSHYPVIAQLFSSIIRSQSIPKEWNIHKIFPLHKKNDYNIISNYRPISLLCILHKVLESLVYNKIIGFIHPKISKSQFGFLKKRSTLSQLLISYSSIYNQIEKKSNTDVIYLDFAKAFDSIPHDEILYKLWLTGITGPLWMWFREYLRNRSHFVEIDGFASKLLPVRSGVSQGSVLGPLLFLVYVNDIPSLFLCLPCLCWRMSDMEN